MISDTLKMINQTKKPVRIESDPVSTMQFKIFRLIFGIYLIWHFISLVPYATELFGKTGMIPDPSLNPTWTTLDALIPTWVGMIPESDRAIVGLLNIMVVCSCLFAIGIWQNLDSLVLWFGWAFLFNRNNLIANPGIPFVGWLLLACAIIPNPGFIFMKDSRVFRRRRVPIRRVWERQPSGTSSRLIRIEEPKETLSPVSQTPLYKWEKKGVLFFQMPLFIYWSAWFLMALGYTISGIHKLQCDSWLDGSALNTSLQEYLHVTILSLTVY